MDTSSTYIFMIWLHMMLLISEMLLTNNDVKVVDNEVHDNVDEVVASKVFFSRWCCCIHSVRAALTDRGWLDYHSHGQQPSTILRLCIISILILFAIECNLINRSIKDCRDLCFSPLLSKSCHFLGLLSRLKWGSEQRISVEAKLRLLSKCPPILFPLDWSVVRVCIPDILKQIRAV